jgi:hypothetical protein
LGNEGCNGQSSKRREENSTILFALSAIHEGAKKLGRMRVCDARIPHGPRDFVAVEIPVAAIHDERSLMPPRRGSRTPVRQTGEDRRLLHQPQNGGGHEGEQKRSASDAHARSRKRIAPGRLKKFLAATFTLGS